jgi:hypothetical protein
MIACLCTLASWIMPELREIAQIINLIADLFYHTVSGCMTAQVRSQVPMFPDTLFYFYFYYFLFSIFLFIFYPSPQHPDILPPSSLYPDNPDSMHRWPTRWTTRRRKEGGGMVQGVQGRRSMWVWDKYLTLHPSTTSTKQHTQHTGLCTLYPAHCIQHTAHSTQQIAHSTQQRRGQQM